MRVSKNLLISVALSATWTLYVFARGSGGIFIGGDAAGCFDWRGVFRDFGHIPYIALISYAYLFLTGNNPYLSFYLTLFTNTLIFLLGSFYLIDSAFSDLCEKDRTFLKLSAGILYILNPLGIVDTFKSAIFRLNSLNGLFLAAIGKYIRILDGETGVWDYVKLAVLVALSMKPIPNCYRLAAIYAIVFAVFAVVKKVKLSRILNVKVVPSVVVFILLSSWWLKPLISSPHKFLNVVETVARKRYYSAGLFSMLRHRYSQIVYVLRLVDFWGFFKGYAPYAKWYLRSVPITICSFLLPIMAFTPLLFKIKQRKTYESILSMAVLMLIAIAWDTEANPPFGGVYVFLVAHIPMLKATLKHFFMTISILSNFYPIAISLSLLLIYRSLKCRYRLVLISLMIVALVIPAWPIIDGSAFGQYFNESIKGIKIPEDYFAVKKIVEKQGGGTILICPRMPIYVLTSWGYQGTERFYIKFFEPFSVIVPDTFGGYSIIAYKRIRNLYVNLSDPYVIVKESGRFVRGSKGGIGCLCAV